MRRFLIGIAVAAALAVGVATSLAGGTKPTTIVYDNFSSAAASSAKWAEPYGPGEASQADNNHFLKVAGNTEEMKALPFRTGADFSVYDHLKLMETSTQSFAVPASGSIAFSSDVTASTPGTVRNLTQTGIYGPGGFPGYWADPLAPPVQPNYSAPVLEGQQAGVVLNMIDFCTGQLFDWFLSSSQAFTLIERLPTNITGNTSNPNCPGANYVGPSLMYTQIADVVAISQGKHNVSIRYTKTSTDAYVEYLLDGKVVTRIGNIGIPLDKQGVHYTGTYPSLGPGELLKDQIKSFTIGHGLFSLIDAFPFQHPDVPDLSVSIPVGTGSRADAGRARLFGQGADGVFDNISVTTTSG
jgi:uncharacterized protein DUF6081